MALVTAAMALAGSAVGVEALTACSSSSAAPPVLGSCTPQHEAGCAVGGSGGSTGGGDSGLSSSEASTDDSGDDGSSGSCGTADELILGSTPACKSCVDTYCCAASAACTGQCLSLVQCATGQINNCAAQTPGGVSNYDTLAQCLGGAPCASQCPALPIPSGDF